MQRTQPNLAADPGRSENTICLEASPSPKPCGIPERARPFVTTRWMAEARRNEGSAFPAMPFCVAAMTPVARRLCSLPDRPRTAAHSG